MYRKVALVLACAAMLLTMVSFAGAQGIQGKSELNFAGGWIDVEDLNATLLIGEYGKFIGPKLELQSALIYADLDGETLWGVAPTAAYYFNLEPESTGTFYAGAGFYFVDGEDMDSESDFTLLAGYKHFLGDTAADAKRAVSIEYRRFNGDGFDLSGIMGSFSLLF